MQCPSIAERISKVLFFSKSTHDEIERISSARDPATTVYCSPRISAPDLFIHMAITSVTQVK